MYLKLANNLDIVRVSGGELLISDVEELHPGILPPDGDAGCEGHDPIEVDAVYPLDLHTGLQVVYVIAGQFGRVTPPVVLLQLDNCAVILIRGIIAVGDVVTPLVLVDAGSIVTGEVMSEGAM